MRRRDLLALLGSAAASPPLLAAAQQPAMPVIGFLSSRSPDESASLLAAFQRGLNETGYVEGQNVALEYRWADGRNERLAEMAADLAARKVGVIASLGGAAAALAAKSASSTIPIVFIVGDDPVALGLVASLARPARNLTGVSFLNVDLNPKRFELLYELVPRARKIALLVNPSSPQTERVLPLVQQAARTKGIELAVLNASSGGEIDAAFASLVALPADALLVASDVFFSIRREQIVTLAGHNAVPAAYPWREFAAAGGLMSYGTSLAAVYQQSGIYTGKVLAGAKPADLPVEQPIKFELVINLNTAKALGLAVPQTLLARADEVIE